MTWTKEALQFEAGKAYCILSYYDWVYATFPFNSRLNLNRLEMALRRMK